MEKIFVIPVPGGLVRFPNSREALPATGGYVPDDVYWARRLMHGDVVKGEPIKDKPIDEPFVVPLKKNRKSEVVK